MTLEGFIAGREDSWRELEELIGAARGRADRLGPERALRMGTLYRSAAADLALARRRFAAEPVRDRLEATTAAASSLIYAGRGRRASVGRFFARGYWVRVAERPAMLLVATLLLLAPALLLALWAGQEPDAALELIPAEFEGATDPPREDGGTPAQEAAFSAFLFTNNIRVTLVAFALGITAGIGTSLLLASNGVLLGAVAGLAIEAGNGRAFLEFIIPHGPIELSCVVVAGAAGLRLGWAVASPGTLPRGKAIAAEARAAAEMVLGTMPWLVAAGLSEAFVRGSGLPLGALAGIGLGLFALFWGLVYTRGSRYLAAARRGEPRTAAGEPMPAPAT